MIHQYKNNGYDIIMDVNSGAVHVVEDVVYDAVAILAEEMPELEKPEPIPSQLAKKVREAIGYRRRLGGHPGIDRWRRIVY